VAALDKTVMCERVCVPVCRSVCLFICVFVCLCVQSADNITDEYIRSFCEYLFLLLLSEKIKRTV